MASNLSINIEVLLEGLASIREFTDATGDAVSTVKQFRGAARDIDELTDAQEEAAKATLEHARTLAQLKELQGDSAGAAKVLEDALRQVSGESDEAAKAQRRFADSAQPKNIVQGFQALAAVLQLVSAGLNLVNLVASRGSERTAERVELLNSLAEKTARIGKAGAQAIRSLDKVGLVERGISLAQSAAQELDRAIDSIKTTLGDAAGRARAFFGEFFTKQAKDASAVLKNVEQSAQSAAAAASKAKPSGGGGASAEVPLLRAIREANQQIIAASRAADAEKLAEKVRTIAAQADKATTSFRVLGDAKRRALVFLRDETGALDLNAVLNRLQGLSLRVRDSLTRVGASLKGAFGGNTLSGVFSAFDRLAASGRFAFGSLASGLSNTKALLGIFAGFAITTLTAVGATLFAIGPASAALFAATGGLKAIGAAGIEANANLEQLKIGIATILASVADIKDAQGALLTGSDALNAALPISEDLLRRLRVASLETALSFEQLGQGLLQALGPGLAAGLNESQVLDLVISMSQLVGPLTGNVAQLGQEIRGLLTGNINNTTLIARALQISPDDIQKAKERNELAKFLNKELAVAASTGKIMGQTFAAASSNLREAGTLIATEVTTGLFNTLRDKINQVLPQVFDKSKANLISAQFTGIADTLKDIFDTVGIVVGNVIDAVTAGIKQISVFLAENRETVVSIIAVTEEIFRQLGGIIVDLFRATGQTVGWADRLRTVAEVGKTIAIVLAAVRNIIKGLVAGVTVFGSAIARSVLFPIQKALSGLAGLFETLAQFVPAFGDAARFARSIASSLQGTINVIARTQNEAGNVFKEALGNIGKTSDAVVKRIDGADKRLDAFRKRQQKRDETRFPGASVTGRKPKPEEEDAAKKSTLAALRTLGEAELALRQAFAQRAVDLARLEAEQENAILDRQLEDKQISLESYYREKAILIEAAKKREVDAVNAEIALERDRLAEVDAIEASAQKAAKNTADRENARLKAAGDRLRINAKIVDLETKLNQAEAKAAADAEENMRRRAKAARDLVDVLNEIPEAITRGVGAGFGQIFDETLRRLDTTRTRLDSELATSVQNIQNLVNLGLIGEIEARERILALEADKRKALEQNLQLVLETLRAELARPGVSSADRAGIQAQIAQTQLSLAQLKSLGVDPLFKSIRSGLENDLSGAFFQFLTAAEFGLDSIRDLAVGIVDSFRRAVAKLLLDQIEKAIIKPLTDKFLGFLGLDSASLGQTAQTVATNANTAALVTLTGAITGSTIAGQIGDGFALSLPDDLGSIAGQGGQNDPAAPLQNVFDRIGNSIKDFAKKIGGFVGNIGSGLKSIASAIVGFLSNLLGGLFGGGSNPAASPDLMAGFADGGLTPGAAGQVAGFVHGSEFVEPAHVVSRWGSGFFEALRTGAITPANISGYLSRLANFRPATPRFGGFASGGLVGAVEPQTASSGGGRGLRIINVNDGTDVANFLDSAQGEQVILNRITRSPAKFRAALGVA